MKEPFIALITASLALGSWIGVAQAAPRDVPRRDPPPAWNHDDGGNGDRDADWSRDDGPRQKHDAYRDNGWRDGGRDWADRQSGLRRTLDELNAAHDKAVAAACAKINAEFQKKLQSLLDRFGISGRDGNRFQPPQRHFRDEFDGREQRNGFDRREQFGPEMRRVPQRFEDQDRPRPDGWERRDGDDDRTSPGAGPRSDRHSDVSANSDTEKEIRELRQQVSDLTKVISAEADQVKDLKTQIKDLAAKVDRQQDRQPGRR